MARSYQIPGGGFLNETGARAYQIPGHGFVIETSSTTTAIYTKSRVANAAGSPGGTAKSRGAIVNAGGV